MDWIKKTFKSEKNSGKVAWRATQGHHPMFANNQPDAFNIIDRFLPVLREYDVDVYFNGHEHVTSYAHAPHKSVEIVPPPNLTPNSGFFGSLKKAGTCKRNVEHFWHSKSRSVEYKQGDHLHQITIGSNGNSAHVCYDTQTSGDFYYSQNTNWSFALVSVTDSEFKI